jgi:hypothetical protein
MLQLRCYPLEDAEFRASVIVDVFTLGGDPQPRLLERRLRSRWPAVRVIPVEPMSPHGDPVMFVFRDGHAAAEPRAVAAVAKWKAPAGTRRARASMRLRA